MKRFSVLVGILACFAGSFANAQCVIPTNGMTITTNTTFCPGTYHLASGVTIAASNVTLTGGGAVIYGNDTGYGVRATNCNNVTVKELSVRHYFHDMHFQSCNDLTIHHCITLLTPELPEGNIFLNIFDGPTGSYGHAIWLRYCARPVIHDCLAYNQQNGISLFDCTAALVENNTCNYNTGWGITLYNTDNSTIRNNNADYCTRDYGGWSGADAASLLMVYGSDYNQITDNSLVGGGDGVFLAGATHNLERRPNNNNYFARNDCSDSPNNGFEGTFSQYNVYEYNITDRCNYGYWLGYSSLCTVQNNRANNCLTAGIAIEHGHQNTITGNELRFNADAIYLWTDDDNDLVAVWPECRDSWGYTIRGNTIAGNGNGIHLAGGGATRLSYDYTIENNAIDENQYGVYCSATTGSLIQRNFIRRNSTVGLTMAVSSGNNIYDNYFRNNANATSTQLNTWNLPKTAGQNIVTGVFRGGNFWSDYHGTDTNGDGLGDTAVPHRSAGIALGGDALPLYLPGPDCNSNGIPDANEPDCDGNGTPDDCESAPDCNLNRRPDSCDLADGTSLDLNGTGRPDECEFLGDLNCSGKADFADINPFVLALADRVSYAAAYPLCNISFADVNGDGVVDFGDINPFVQLIIHYAGR
jgi:parallel beta-helix repeat protein